jgi:hypothetical protein
MSPTVGSMIAKTFFLAKIIHRILTRSLRGKKSLRQNLIEYRKFFALRVAWWHPHCGWLGGIRIAGGLVASALRVAWWHPHCGWLGGIRIAGG